MKLLVLAVLVIIHHKHRVLLQVCNGTSHGIAKSKPVADFTALVSMFG